MGGGFLRYILASDWRGWLVPLESMYGLAVLQKKFGGASRVVWI